MKYWGVLFAAILGVLIYGATSQENLASRITLNIEKMSTNDVYASSNPDAKLHYVKKRPDMFISAYQALIKAGNFIPKDCTQAFEIHKQAIKSYDNTMISTDAKRVLTSMAAYCVELDDPMHIFVLASRNDKK